MTGGAGVSALSAVFAQDVWMALRAFSLRCAEGPADGFHWTAFLPPFRPSATAAALLFFLVTVITALYEGRHSYLSA